MDTRLPKVVSERPVIEWVGNEWLEHRLDVHFYEPRFLQNLAQVRSLDLKKRLLRRLARIDGGGAYPASEFSEEGAIPIAKIGDITNQRYPDEWVYLGYQAFEHYGKTETHYPDVLVTMTGDPPDIGKCMLVPQWESVLAYNQRVARARFANLDVNTFYVCAFLSTEWARLQLEKVCTGIRQRHVTLDDIRRMIVPLPSQPVQTYIGDKVRLAGRCRMRARELQQQMQSALDRVYQGAPIESKFALDFWVEPTDLDSPRIDAWHYQPIYQRLVKWCHEQRFALVSSVASLAQRRWSPAKSKKLSFHYIEISDIDTSTGQVVGRELPTTEAPGRARQVVKAFDILISTVRPERKGIGIITSDMDGWIATTGFSILRTKESLLSYYLCAVLRHDASTLQIMRWNTGAAYPAVDADVPLNVLIPFPDDETVKQVGENFKDSIELNDRAAAFAAEAKADVEALIEGRLDVEGILDGRVKAPTWEDIAV